MYSILVTGASGFIGSTIAEMALDAGLEVWCGMRATSSRKYLADERLHFIELDLGNRSSLQAAFERHLAVHEPFSGVIHAAGATKCRQEAEFFRTNTDGTRLLAETLAATGALAGRFVFLSSLSVMGAPLEGDLSQVLTAEMKPEPNTAYGRSKWLAEQALESGRQHDYVILRPTGVYGPRERDYFLMAQSIARHIDFAAGFSEQRITFIYVRDLACAALLALTEGPSRAIYFLSDGESYTSRAFSDLLQQHLGVRGVLHFTAPLWLLHGVCAAGELSSRLTGRACTLNLDKYHILRQRNWQCDIRPARERLGFRPEWNLERGVAATVAWYRKNHWI